MDQISQRLDVEKIEVERIVQVFLKATLTIIQVVPLFLLKKQKKE